MLGLAHLQCCTGSRNKWLSRRDSDSRRASIEVPTSSLSEQRRSKLANHNKYSDGEIQIDRTGLHIRGGQGPAHRGSGWADMLKASRSFHEDDDDCLSVASTQVPDDASEAGSSRSFRSSDHRRQKGECSHGLSSSSGLSQLKLPGDVDLRNKSNKRLVKYENISKVCVIGKGTSGLVWRCIDKSNCDSLALKEVPLDDDEEKTKMTVRELVTMYGVEHSGVVTCHEVFYSRGSFQMVLEYMDGGSLLDALRRSRDQGGHHGLSASALTVIGYSVAGALQMLHDVLEVVHRDVKPGNILLTSRGQVKLADLGICTHPGSVQDGEGDASSGGAECCETPATEWIGTLTYMSPERLVGDAYSFNADIWSLGIVLVEAAIGHYPLAGADEGASLQFWDLLDRVLSEPCPSHQMRGLGAEWEGVRTIAEACLDKDPKERPRARDLKRNAVLQSGESAVLAEWVCRHLPFEKAGKSEPLKESEMWA